MIIKNPTDDTIYINIGGKVTEIKPMTQEEHDIKFPPPISITTFFETADDQKTKK